MNMNWARLTFAPLLLLGLSGCEVDVKDRGELPEVEVTPGRAPDVDVEGPDIDVKTREKTIEVPDVEVKTRKKTIEVPDIEVNPPRDDEN